MEFTNTDPEVRFTLVDRPTVRQQLDYWATAQLEAGTNRIVRQWNALQLIIEEWECPCMPDRYADLGELVDPDVTRVILWAARQGLTHMAALDEVPKNS